MMSNGPPARPDGTVDDARWLFPQERAPSPLNEALILKLVRKLDARIDAFEAKFDAHVDAFKATYDAFEAKLDARFGNFEAKVTTTFAKADAELGAPHLLARTGIAPSVRIPSTTMTWMSSPTAAGSTTLQLEEVCARQDAHLEALMADFRSFADDLDQRQPSTHASIASLDDDDDDKKDEDIHIVLSIDDDNVDLASLNDDDDDDKDEDIHIVLSIDDDDDKDEDIHIVLSIDDDDVEFEAPPPLPLPCTGTVVPFLGGERPLSTPNMLSAFESATVPPQKTARRLKRPRRRPCRRNRPRAPNNLDGAIPSHPLPITGGTSMPTTTHLASARANDRDHRSNMSSPSLLPMTLPSPSHQPFTIEGGNSTYSGGGFNDSFRDNGASLPPRKCPRRKYRPRRVCRRHNPRAPNPLVHLLCGGRHRPRASNQSTVS